MAYVKLYERINWVNKSDGTTTPLGASNLNKIDHAVNELDNRTVELDTKKAEQSTVLNMVSSWTMDESTGIITVTKLNGEQIMFDLNIEKIPVSFSMTEDGILTMTTEDGTEYVANISSMIPVIEFENSDTISVTKRYDGTKIASNVKEYTHEFTEAYTGYIYFYTIPSTSYKVSIEYLDGSEVPFVAISSPSSADVIVDSYKIENAVKLTITSDNALSFGTEKPKTIYGFSVIDGSITDEKLQPSYLADIKVQAQSASASATSAEASAVRAETAATGAEETLENVVKKDDVIPIDKGGTGATTAKEAQYNLLKDMNQLTTDVVDENIFAGVYTEPAGEKGVIYKRTALTFWNYIKSKISSILGLTADEYNGNSATATTLSETLPIDKGGTGATTVKGAEYSILSGMTEVTSTRADESLLAGVYITPSSTQGKLYYFKSSLHWDYIKSKISSVLGLTATNYTGTSAKATADASGNVIADTYATKTAAKKVTQSVSDTDQYRAFLMGATQSESASGLSTDVDGIARITPKIYGRCSDGSFFANYLYGTLKGNAAPVNNLLATVAGKPLDAVQGKALGDKIAALGGFTPVIDETTGKITGYTTTIGGADTVFPFSSENTALLALEAGPTNASATSAYMFFSNEDYFDTTEGNVCTKACSGTIYLRWRTPLTMSNVAVDTTITITINDETIYTITATGPGRENIEFNCNAGDVVVMTVQKANSNYGRAMVMALFVGN